jgi:hypothetical protein
MLFSKATLSVELTFCRAVVVGWVGTGEMRSMRHLGSDPFKIARKPMSSEIAEALPTSQKRIETNRRNAQKSTGPKTASGKNIVRRNALKHGLTAEKVVVFGEDPQAFHALAAAHLADIKPRNSVERELCTTFTLAAWRRRRCASPTSALYARERLENQGLVDFSVTIARPSLPCFYWTYDLWRHSERLVQNSLIWFGGRAAANSQNAVLIGGQDDCRNFVRG